jgi:transposase-like protein
MAPRKLSETDKLEITKLYCQPGETTSTLAKRFGVSSSTVSRVLKQMLADDDYAQLMQWKRSGERGTLNLEFQVPVADESALPEPTVAVEPVAADEPADQPAADEPIDQPEGNKPRPKTQRRSRRRSAAARESVPEYDEASVEAPALNSATAAVESAADVGADVSLDATDLEVVDETGPDAEEQLVAAWVSDGLEDSEDYEDDDYEDDEDDEDEEDWDEEDSVDPTLQPRQEQIEILPFDDFLLQKPCYLVVDRLSELITCPLKEFAELGLIPSEEEQSRTLPIFDNHRVARRFARRNQRIIKIPNGLMLSKTQPYLEAKGITRLLFDGQVYALN